MTKLSTLLGLTTVAALVGVATPVWAESAPVYDVDDVYQSLDSVQGEFQPPPPQPQDQADYSSSEPAYMSAPPPRPRGSVSERLQQVEQQVTNMQNSDSAAKMDSLQQEVQGLRGQVEQLTHELQQLQAQQKAMYSDLDKRVNEKSAITSAKPVTAESDDAPKTLSPADKPVKKSAKPEKTETAKSSDTGAQPNVAEEQQIYQTAYNFIKAKKYDDAVKALQGMLKKYQSGQFAANAHYWLGELYGLMNQHDDALKEFGSVVKSFPDSPRVSDAQMKIGLIYAAKSDWSDARSAFKKVINKYPGTASAKLASEQLKQIKKAGH